MKMIKAFMFDMDGTLINADCKASELMIKTLDSLQAQGYPLAINSGRPIVSSMALVDKEFKDKDYFCYCYGSNGSEFYDTHTKEFKLLSYLDAKTISDINEIFNVDYLTLGMYRGLDFLINKERDDDALQKWCAKRDLKTYLYDYKNNTEAFSKILGFYDEELQSKVLAYAGSIDDPRFDTFASARNLLEIVPKGMTKAKAVEDFAKRLGIETDEIMCFGDLDNDVPALKISTGVFLGSEELSKKFGLIYHTGSVYEDGIYHFLVDMDFIDG